MSDASSCADEGVLALMRRSNAETAKFVEEAYKLRAEEAELRAEKRKLGRDALVVPLATLVTALSAFGALVISIVTLLRSHS